ncbi:esterase [Tsukamurella asaccharolytica]|uniref:Esterase n=1 Tax=Tsukamurella asaccharolytica TaxID=2592067 RepID=A0A5C5RAF6_9ACTN|nr:esterase [Tsukamurella asaccharolytica]TWS19798.1 esterase [Tsukamurella asaccharolytica]
MNTRITRTLGAVAAAVALTLTASACDNAGDTATDAKDAATSAAGDAASGAGESGTNGSGAGESGANGAGSESKAAVPSTTIATPGGTEVTLTDGPLIAAYATYGYEKGHLGAPLGPVATLPDGKGRYLTLTGGTIYWSEASGAHVVHGVIGQKWGAEGHESGRLGYPTSDESAENGGIKQTFQHGTITFRDGVATIS